MRLITTMIASLAVFTVAYASTTGSSFQGFELVTEMPIARSDMTVSTYTPSRSGRDVSSDSSNGTRFYLIGGCHQDQICDNPNSTLSCYCPGLTNKTQYYLPETDEYVTTCADAPRDRYRHAAAVLDGTIYLFGGRDAQDHVVQQIDAYNIEQNTWSTPCTWINATSDNTAFVANGQDIYLAGGYYAHYTSVGEVLRFHPNNCSLVPRAPMPSPRGDVQSITVNVSDYPGGPRELHFVLGGFSSDYCNGSRDVTSYDATTNMWTNHADLILGRADMALGDINGDVFAIAGETIDCKPNHNRSVPVTDVEMLARGTNTQPPFYNGSWVQSEEIPTERFRFAGVSYAPKTAIYLFGGQGIWQDDITGDGRGGFPIQKTAVMYIPKEYRNDPKLSKGAIAGIAIAGIVVGSLIVVAIITYVGARGRYQLMDKSSPRESSDVVNNPASEANVDWEEPSNAI
eukprot:m.832257 g.832257  ORF g.832257 m.832257 type:complete len:457 (-) comp23435_c0_seq11:246-1616(-)